MEAVERSLDDDPDATLGLLAELTAAADPGLRAAARELAARLWWRLARRGRPAGTGVGRLASTPYRPDGGDLDVDRSLEAIVEARAARRALDPAGLWTRRWATPRTAWCLLLDHSGSMTGQSLATAALTTAAVLLRAGSERAVLSFGRDVVAVTSMTEGRPDDEVVDRVLSLRGHGTTDLAGALRAGADQLGRSTAARRVTVLLSDCRATEPGDVVAAAALHEELVVLAPADDPAAARGVASAAGGRLATIDGPTSVPAALAAALG